MCLCAENNLAVLVCRLLYILLIFYLLKFVAIQYLLVLVRLTHSSPPIELLLVGYLLSGYNLL